MIRLEAPDATQSQLEPLLEVTESLMRRALRSVNKRTCDAEIIPLPDLGLPHNGLRASGGFFTGALYRWESSVPFVPIDATVNVCGVSMFRTDVATSSQSEFDDLIRRVRVRVETETPYVWNLANGNHFVILAETDGGGDLTPGRYLLVHASAGEFKEQYNGLYPVRSNWYWDAVQVLTGEGGRYLRYISGDAADRFFNIADSLVAYQENRQWMIAQILADEAGTSIDQVLCRPHYGMPDRNSVAIGCQWLDGSTASYPLLTRPEMPIYMVKPDFGVIRTVSLDGGLMGLAPHGLGVAAQEGAEVRFRPEGIAIGNEVYGPGTNISRSRSVGIRNLGLDGIQRAVLAQAPGQVTATLHQLYSYYRKEN